MINCTCVVQQGQSSDLLKSQMKVVLEAFIQASFGQGAHITWVPVMAGNGYTAGEPSTSSIVSMAADQPLNADRREALLRQLVALWTSKTGATVDEVVAVIADPIPH